MTVEESIKTALATYINRKGVPCTRVTDWIDENWPVSYSGCETCGGDDIEYLVRVYFVAPGGKPGAYEYNGSFTELIRELTD